MKTGKSCDSEWEKKIEMGLDRWSTRLRGECEERPPCPQQWTMSSGLAGHAVYQYEGRRNKTQKRDGDQIRKVIMSTWGFWVLSCMLWRWGRGESVKLIKCIRETLKERITNVQLTRHVKNVMLKMLIAGLFYLQYTLVKDVTIDTTTTACLFKGEEIHFVNINI